MEADGGTSLKSSQQPYKEGAICVALFQIGKLRLREVLQISQGDEWGSQDSTQAGCLGVSAFHCCAILLLCNFWELGQVQRV